MSSDLDRKCMQRAVELAQQAAAAGEVPVGAVVVRGDDILGEGYNRPISSHDPSAHAEIIAIRDAAANIKNYRLVGCVLYATLEPCIMCAGAILHARIDRLVFGARDPKSGAAGSRLNLIESEFLNHRAAVEAGVLEQPCAELLRQFFSTRRGRD